MNTLCDIPDIQRGDRVSDLVEKGLDPPVFPLWHVDSIGGNLDLILPTVPTYEYILLDILGILSYQTPTTVEKHRMYCGFLLLKVNIEVKTEVIMYPGVDYRSWFQGHV